MFMCTKDISLSVFYDFIEVLVQSQECEWPCLCVLGYQFVCVSMILLNCLYKARNVSDHVYVYYGYQFVCVSMILLK